ncbi:Tumor necrosis factor TNF-alpha [Triplophysa tibetana]|uniref:Tumor necrosis factor TNF-alpha n=1 Tax=Triplophysa tibetana TaxID=1572043 RepID=A0A5A9P6C2_9TELE|nr:Tumor necrosis factor TNF-alpha [Triplophysa tibetana]
MTSNLQISPNYCQLDEIPSENKHARGQYIFFLVLTLLLGTEMFVTACVLFNFWEDIRRTDEAGYPVHCLSSDLTQTTGRQISSCDLFNEELQRSAQQVFAIQNLKTFLTSRNLNRLLNFECKILFVQRLLLDIQNSLLESLGEHNITDVFNPAVHVGAKQELKQFQGPQMGQNFTSPDGSADVVSTLHRIQWDNTKGQISQEGLMRLSPSGEIAVPQDGIYFVFAQVHFETHIGNGLHFAQYLYKRTASYSWPVMLAKAVVTPCMSGSPGVQLYSSHQGALFRLEKGDRLSLYVSNISAVRFPLDATYFGAFMIN